MSFTVGDLCFEAAIMAGQADPRDGSLAPEDARYAFSKLNQFVDLLATERLAIYREQRVGPFAVTAGMGDATVPAPITIGSGATWDTPRPIWIDRAGVIYTSGNVANRQPELRMTVFTTKEWAKIQVKGTASTLSRAMFYDRNFTSAGYGNIYLYPVPSASFEVVLYVPVAVTEFPNDVNDNPDFTTVIALPPGYRAMLIANLAVMLNIGVAPVSDDLRSQAVLTLGSVKSANVVTHMDALGCDDAICRVDYRNSPFDWITGGFD